MCKQYTLFCEEFACQQLVLINGSPLWLEECKYTGTVGHPIRDAGFKRSGYCPKHTNTRSLLGDRLCQAAISPRHLPVPVVNSQFARDYERQSPNKPKQHKKKAKKQQITPKQAAEHYLNTQGYVWSEEAHQQALKDMKAREKEGACCCRVM